MTHGGEFENRIEHDFSVNVNPVKTPGSVLSAMRNALECVDQYPQIHSGELVSALAKVLNAEEKNILVGNGSSELFPAVVNAFPPCKILIPVPSFYGYEYAACSKKNDVRVMKLEISEEYAITKRFTDSLKNELAGGYRLLFLANPNNPTGKIIPPELLADILEFCKTQEITVVLDECFYEFTGEKDSMFHHIKEYPNLIVISSFTKTFSIPAVRLGYLASGNEEYVNRIRRQLPEWNVSGIAQAAGLACLKHPEHMVISEKQIRYERDFLMKGIRELGIKVFDSDANFLLLYTERPLYEELLKCGIGIRDASNFRGLGKGYYRIAVKSREENFILLNALRKIFGNSVNNMQ